MEKSTQALTLAYQLNFEQPIWQIRFAETTGLLAIECRDPEALQVSYNVVDATSGALVLNNYQPANSWWTSLADLKEQVLFLHQMGTTGMGQAKEIIALGLAEEKVIWQLAGYSLYSFLENKLYARPVSAETATVVGLNIEAGTLTGEEINLSEVAPVLATFQAWRSEYFRVPAHYPADNNYFAELSRFLFLKTGFVAIGAIDYLETEDRLIIGFYPESSNPEKTYRVAVFSRLGDLLGQEEAGKDFTRLGTDNFFLFGEKLFLLKNKKSLLAFRF